MAARRRHETKAAPAEEALAETYAVRDPEAVRRFVRKHPWTIEAALEARPALVRAFGEHADFSVGVVADPEVEDWEQLVVFVETKLDPKEARERMDRFDEDWFFARMAEIGDQVWFMLHFR